jgi:hypothetical protein
VLKRRRATGVLSLATYLRPVDRSARACSACLIGLPLKVGDIDGIELITLSQKTTV